jgi:hypothetical protein
MTVATIVLVLVLVFVISPRRKVQCQQQDHWDEQGFHRRSNPCGT